MRLTLSFLLLSVTDMLIAILGICSKEELEEEEEEELAAATAAAPAGPTRKSSFAWKTSLGAEKGSCIPTI